MAVTSLKTAPEIQRVPLQIAPDSWLNFSNYAEVFKREPFLRYLLNSAIVASIAAVSSVVVSSLAGSDLPSTAFPDATFFPRHRRHPDGPFPVGRRCRCTSG
jgi:multiple sugar transport system permease protein